MDANLSGVEVNIDVRGRTPIEATLGAIGAVDLASGAVSETISFRTRGTLRFRASAEARRVALLVAEDQTIGPVRLHEGVALRPTRVERDTLHARVDLDGGTSVEVGPLACRALRLVSAADAAEAAGAVPEDAPDSVDALTGRTVVVGARGVRVTIRGARPMRFKRVGGGNGWTRIRRDYPRGVTVDGWVRPGEVRTTPPLAVPGNGVAVPFPSLSLRGVGTCLRAVSHAMPVRVRARADGRTVVRDGPGGPAWATVAPGAQLQGYRDCDGVEPAALDDILNCDAYDRAWVAIEDLVPEP